MQQKSVTISEHGHVIIPKDFRNYLNSKTVLIQKEEDHSIKLIPIPDLGGSLSQYSTKNIDFKQARDEAWDEEIESKFNTKNK